MVKCGRAMVKCAPGEVDLAAIAAIMVRQACSPGEVCGRECLRIIETDSTT